MRLTGLAIVALAVGAALAPIDPAWVERFFARGWYPVIQPVLTGSSNLLPIAVLDVLVAAVALWLAAGAWRVVRTAAGRRGRALLAWTWRVTVGGATVYLVFLACWGLHYRRGAITQGLDFQASRVTPGAVEAATVSAIAQLNQLHRPAHAELAQMPTSDALRPQLSAAFATAVERVGRSHRVATGRPRRSMVSPFLRYAGVDGFINPLGLEVILNPDVLPVERPFVLAHEWGHLAGWARESEASYVAWVTCRAGGPALGYSGWLALYWHLRGAVDRRALERHEAGLAEGPRADLRAIAARLARANPRVREASWQTYDRFLKANRVESGVRNYDEVVQLVLGIAADESGRPLVARPR